MNALRLFTVVAALGAVLGPVLGAASAAQAQSAAEKLGRPAGPTRQVDNRVPQPGEREKLFPLGSSWIAVSLNGRPFTTADRPSFRLDDQLRASGFGGCNNYSATAYPLREQGLAVGPFALTKKTCDRATMAAEQSFLMALRTSMKWEIQGPILTIRTQNGELRFQKML